MKKYLSDEWLDKFTELDDSYVSEDGEIFVNPFQERFWERYEEEKRKALLHCAREFGEDAPWEEISKQLKEEDIDFIREFRQFIHWDELNTDKNYETSFYKEFKEEIEKAYNEIETGLRDELILNSKLIDSLISEIY